MKYFFVAGLLVLLTLLTASGAATETFAAPAQDAPNRVYVKVYAGKLVDAKCDDGVWSIVAVDSSRVLMMCVPSETGKVE